jgi:hypothetical protein
MFRRFKFEDEVHQTLSCVPMAVRRKLDRIGVKLSLDQWQHLARSERLAICHLPAESGEERDATRTFIEEAVLSRSNIPTKALSEEVRRSAEPPSMPPMSLTELARTHGVALGQSEWDRLDSDERYALIKLSGGPTPSHNLAAALHEFLG